MLKKQLLEILKEVENSEKYLTVDNMSFDERCLGGSFYTPLDVTPFFHNCFLKNVENFSINDSIINDVFIEPSCGSGILFFSFLKELLDKGVSEEIITNINFYLFDINIECINFSKKILNDLELSIGKKFKNITFINQNFLLYDLQKLVSRNTPIHFIGNPPYTKQSKKENGFPNSFGNFTLKCLENMNNNGSINFIIPISVLFSKNYSIIRNLLKENKMQVEVVSFDKIPDTFFKFGKPGNVNTNKSNSQAVCILTVINSSKKYYCRSSKLNKWFTKDREKIFSIPSTIDMVDVTDYNFDCQIPRPENDTILNKFNDHDIFFKDIIKSGGEYEIYIAKVARNFIGIREEIDAGSQILKFDNIGDFYLAITLLSSADFFSYWRTLSDGFHITKGLIYNYPLKKESLTKNAIDIGRSLWNSRLEYRVEKKNAGKLVKSYKFPQNDIF